MLDFLLNEGIDESIIEKIHAIGIEKSWRISESIENRKSPRSIKKFKMLE